MKRLFINDFSEIAELMHEKVCEGCEEATFIGFYDDAVDVLKELAQMDEPYIYQVAIEPEDWDGYDKEYLVTLGDDFSIWCEKAFRQQTNNYIKGLCGCVIIADDCHKECLEDVDTDCIYVASYDLSNEEYDQELITDSNSEYHTVSRTKDGKIAGFTKSWSNTDENGINYYSSFSHYGNNEDAVKRLAKEFGINI